MMRAYFKPLVLSLALASIALGGAFAQYYQNAAAPSKSDVRQNARTEQALIHMEQGLTDALMKGDVAPQEQYIADTWIFTRPDGVVQDKPSMIAGMKVGDLKIEASKLDQVKVQLYGNTAVFTCHSTDKATYKGQEISGQYRWTDIWVKRGGKWQMVAKQGTSVPPQ